MMRIFFFFFFTSVTFYDSEKLCLPDTEGSIIYSHVFMAEINTGSALRAPKWDDAFVLSDSFDMVSGESVCALKVRSVCCKIQLQWGKLLCKSCKSF